MKPRSTFNIVLTGIALLISSAARADVVVTLAPQNDQTNVAPGATLLVDVLLSVDARDNPLPHIRLIQLDFGDTDDSLVVETIEWNFELESGPDLYLLSTALPVAYAASIATSGIDGFIINLDETPFRVATIEVIVNDSGVLDVVGTASAPEDSAALISARFDFPADYTLALANLSGGTLALRADGAPDDDADDDGVPDAVDDLPNNANENTDTDNDNLGNVSDDDDDGDGIVDDDDQTPLGEQPTSGNDNAASNENGNDNTADDNDNVVINDNTGGNDNDENEGPRVTGGLCAPGMIGFSLWTLLGLSALRWISSRRR